MAQHHILSLDCMLNTLSDAQLLSGRQALPDPQRQAMLRLLQRATQQALTAKQQECVRLYYGEGMTMAEIGIVLEIQKSGVCRHLQKARKRLEQILRCHFPERLAG